MDPTEKGWLQRFVELRSEIPLNFRTGPAWTPQKQIYKYLQPTGILYGHPVELPSIIDLATDQWPVKERLQLIFLESLLSTYCIVHSIPKPSFDQLEEATIEINAFFIELYPAFAKKTLFNRTPKTPFLQLEKNLAKRIKVKAEWNAHFWKGFFHNIILFVDVILFFEFLENKTTKGNFDAKVRLLAIEAQLISFMALVVNMADNEKSKQQLFQFFTESTSLSKDEKMVALAVRDSKQSIQFLKTSNWLVQKYFLELAAISTWADMEIDAQEIELLLDLAHRLEWDDIELETSMFAVESFLLSHWQQIHYLQSKQTYLVLSQRMGQRLTKISKKYARQIKAEIEHDKELVQLLIESQQRTLSLDEKEKVRAQLIDVLRTIPAFVVLAMPMAFLTVPILMKVLPKNLFPSSFDPNKMMNKRGGRIDE